LSWRRIQQSSLWRRFIIIRVVIIAKRVRWTSLGNDIVLALWGRRLTETLFVGVIVSETLAVFGEFMAGEEEEN